MKTRVHLQIFILTFIFTASSFILCSCNSLLPYLVVEPVWTKPPVKIPAKINAQSKYDGTTIELSPDGNLLCVAYAVYVKSLKEIKITYAVYDSKGNIVKDAVDDNGWLSDIYHEFFPVMSLRCSGNIRTAYVGDPINLHLTSQQQSKYADKLAYTQGWFFSTDYSSLVKITNETMADYVKSFPEGAPSNTSMPELKKTDVEFWQLKPEIKKLWTRSVSSKIDKRMGIKSGEFFNRNGIEYVIFNYFLDNAYILAVKDGKLVDRFDYGPKRTDSQKAAIMQQYQLDGSRWKLDLDFKPSHFSFEPVSRLLACADFTSRHIRVISADPPHNIEFEAFADTSPMSPSNLLYNPGYWYSRDISFAGSKYLISSSEAAGRGFMIPFIKRTEIYQVDTWKRIWMTSSPDINDIVLSSDGKKIALTRNDMIEYGDFEDFQNNDKRVLADDFL